MQNRLQLFPGYAAVCVALGFFTLQSSGQSPMGESAQTSRSAGEQIVVRRPAPQSQAPLEGNLPPAPQPQTPATLFQPGELGMVRPAGSGVTYKAAGALTGPSGYAVEEPTGGPLPLSLDDAIGFGLRRNINLRYEQANVRAVKGYRNEITNAIIPNLRFRAASSAQQINLSALGFKPSTVAPLLARLGVPPGSLASIVKVNTTSVQLSLTQTLFNMPDFELLRGVKPELQSVHLTLADSDEQVVQAVTNAYLAILADQANVQNTLAQIASAQVSLDQAQQRDQAGIGIRLDVLRAQVQLQQRQQAHISAETQLDKDGIQLNRIMGIPAGQQLDLTDRTPYSELGDVDLQQAEESALNHRNDLLALQQAIIVGSYENKAIRYQRLPTLAVNGFYGVIGETTGLYHGYFTAEGSVKVPIFREAAQRGEQESAESQLQQLRDQEDNLRGVVDAQVRTSLLDVETSSQLVRVARSNVELAREELSDARARFAAGVNDNLEVVDAETTVTGADAQLISALYQFNVAKVSLARSTGVLQSRYRAFLGM